MTSNNMEGRWNFELQAESQEGKNCSTCTEKIQDS